MDAAWPALDRSTAEGWALRSAGGVTQRANSIWPAREAHDIDAALRMARDWYTARRQPVIFQVMHRPEHAGLDALLDELHYSRQSETLIMTATEEDTSCLAQLEQAAVHIVIAPTPSPQWLDLWWSVDGRGGSEEKAIAERILAGSPALYATALDDQGQAVGTGRLALPVIDGGEGWGGIYSMAVHPTARRQGIATAVLAELVAAGKEFGVENYWLMVTAANAGAQTLYGQAGFAEVGRYHYRQASLRRAPMAC
ncbi:GNAT family N-acetyltransferase [Arthrobacter psychrolactophilus]|uniref:GNAT family N-acetyltransferase n=2 Tax=Arthrobacter psychrolactophilus TaxID=92442 RepID=A0A2V5J481_9MICC|nr:GNAT family N-acetyltransferase [Arthrobacter psychrolactophilus]